MTAAPDDAKKGGKLTVLSEGDIDYMDPGRRTTSSPTWSRGRVPQLVSWPPDDVENPTPDLADGRAARSPKTANDRVHDPGWGQVRPPVDRESYLGGRQVRDRAHAAARCRQRLYGGSTSADVDGYDAAEGGSGQGQTGHPTSRVSRRPTTRRSHRAQQAAGARGVIVQALSLPISAPVPEEYAKEFDAENPSTYGQHVAFTGPYMVENDPMRRADRLHAGQGDQARSEPELGCRPPTFGPRTWTRSTSRRASRTCLGVAARSSTASAQMSGDFPPSPTVLKEARREQ